jgi:hypothetical protein
MFQADYVGAGGRFIEIGINSARAVEKVLWWVFLLPGSGNMQLPMAAD